MLVCSEVLSLLLCCCILAYCVCASALLVFMCVSGEVFILSAHFLAFLLNFRRSSKVQGCASNGYCNM